MRQSIQALLALLIASAILYAGNGLQTTLLSVRANLEGFRLTQIGWLLSAYSLGFIVGCRYTPALVVRVGHIRAFTALASLASAAALGHALTVNPVVWMVLRIVTGFCFAGLTMIIESWINEKASNANRGQVLAVYRMVDLGAIMIGQLLLTLADPLGFTLFALLSILISVSLVPVALTTSIAPRPLEVAHLDLRRLWVIAPLGAAGCLAAGAANGAFWAVGPVFVLRAGFDASTVAVFMSCVIVTGALAQWPLGWLSDRVDRRKVIITIGLLGVVSGFLLAFKNDHMLPLLLGGGLFGVFALPFFGLCAAHANDYADADEYVTMSAGLLLLYGVGAVIGPMLAPLFMQWYGAGFLFVFTAVIYALVTVYGLYRLSVRAPANVDEKEHFVPLHESTPMVFELDPRAPEMDHQDAPMTDVERQDEDELAESHGQ